MAQPKYKMLKLENIEEGDIVLDPAIYTDAAEWNIGIFKGIVDYYKDKRLRVKGIMGPPVYYPHPANVILIKPSGEIFLGSGLYKRVQELLSKGSK